MPTNSTPGIATHRLVELREHSTAGGVPLTSPQAELLRRKLSRELTIRRAWGGDGYDIDANGYVGEVIVDDLWLRLRPKVALDNLFFMLTYAAQLARFRPEQSLLGTADDLFSFIVSIFVSQVDELARRGIVRGYVELEEDAPFLRGRLMLAGHLRRQSTGSLRLYQRAAEFTADLRENRILKATLAMLAGLDFDDASLRPRVRRALSAFSEVAYTPARPKDCDRVLFTRLNERYRSPLALARLLLERLSLESHHGRTSFAAFLLPVHQVFEGFVAGLLRETAALQPRVNVRQQDRLPLDVGGSFTARPDVIIEVDDRPALVIDTKYKANSGKPDEADMYQMAAYCRLLGADRALLVYPDESAAAASYRLRDGRHGTGPEVLTQGVSLSGSPKVFGARWRAWAAELIDGLVV